MDSAPTNPIVVVPALNEEISLPKVLADLSSLLPEIPVLVVDDGSFDDTSSVARSRNVECLRIPINIGVGGAMQAGFQYARRNGFDAVVQVDGDGQHPVGTVTALISALSKDDVVVGSRFLDETGFEVSWIRRVVMRFLANVLSKILKTRLTDVTSGFRASGPRAIDLFADLYPRQYLGDTVESLVIAHRYGLSVGEVTATFKSRQGGVPSQSNLAATLYVGRAVMVLLLALVHRKQ
jgi:glycosyltransferase involved in cell wall biosynthesis